MKTNQEQKQKRVLLLLAFLSAFAWSSGNVQVKSEAFAKMTEIADDGMPVTREVRASKVKPGEVVTFVISYKNVGKEAATDVVLSNPIPEHMIYKSAEASFGAKPEFSVDGGKTWGDLKKLQVSEAQKKRSATAQDVTHVRWKIAKALLPEQEGKARFLAVLK